MENIYKLLPKQIVDYVIADYLFPHENFQQSMKYINLIQHRFINFKLTPNFSSMYFLMFNTRNALGLKQMKVKQYVFDESMDTYRKYLDRSPIHYNPPTGSSHECCIVGTCFKNITYGSYGSY